MSVFVYVCVCVLAALHGPREYPPEYGRRLLAAMQDFTGAACMHVVADFLLGSCWCSLWLLVWLADLQVPLAGPKEPVACSLEQTDFELFTDGKGLKMTLADLGDLMDDVAQLK